MPETSLLYSNQKDAVHVGIWQTPGLLEFNAELET